LIKQTTKGSRIGIKEEGRQRQADRTEGIGKQKQMLSTMGRVPQRDEATTRRVVVVVSGGGSRAAN